MEHLTALYALKETAPIYLIVPVLLFITSPCEEIFWRGFVQRGITQSLGTTKGWLLAAVLYALVHVVSLDPSCSSRLGQRPDLGLYVPQTAPHRLLHHLPRPLGNSRLCPLAAGVKFFKFIQAAHIFEGSSFYPN